MSVGLITDKDLHKNLVKDDSENSIILWQNKNDGKFDVIHVIQASDTKEILEKVLEILPNPEILEEKQFRVSSK